MSHPYYVPAVALIVVAIVVLILLGTLTCIVICREWAHWQRERTERAVARRIEDEHRELLAAAREDER